MQRIIKSFLRQKPNLNQQKNPISINPWKRNVLATIFGLTFGIYVGQYFPDIYYQEIQKHIPTIQALQNVGRVGQQLKPNPQYPRSLFQYPHGLMQDLSKEQQVKQGQFLVKNDVTKKVQKFKVRKVFNLPKQTSQK